MNKIPPIIIINMIKEKEEKMEKYRELGFEFGRLWEVRPKVIPIMVGALGT